MATKKAAATTKRAATKSEKSPAKKTSQARDASAAVDAQLKKYREMRDFHLTKEPRGEKSSSSSSLPFVIQKHAATRLHYDFRLGWAGVLKSWAVTKGPSFYPGDKRLAVQVEDHPTEYGGFEGTIPKGQYGGGTVMLWDHGTWEPHGDADEGLKKGSLKFTLHGEKMHGKWALVRMAPHPERDHGKANWLLIKEHDGFEKSETDQPITESAPNSVVTNRSLDEIGRDQDHSWQSHASSHSTTAAAETAEPPPLKKTKATQSTSFEFPKEAKKEALPAFISPQLAVSASAAPTDAEWLHELKLDGYRMQARIDAKKGKVHLLTRTGLDWTHRMKPLADALAKLPVEAALLDGEVVVLNESGVSSFADLQAAFQDKSASAKKLKLTYFAFDLLHLNGRDLRPLPLRTRKQYLEQLLQGTPANGAAEVRFSEHLETDGAKMFNGACRVGAEGIVSKRADKAYVSGRSATWVKIKCSRQQELVIGGFTLPSKGTAGIGALLLGYYQGDKLIYAGRTGTGFSHQLSATIRKKLEAIQIKDCPYSNPPAEARRGALWVKPQFVAEVAFATWTADNLVRQAAFKGLREDKPAREVVKEDAMPKERAKVAAEKTPVMPKSKPTSAVPMTKSSALSKVRLTHPDKIIDQETQLTKLQLAEYYAAVADVMLPYIAHRPLSLVRCPEGSEKTCFFQKHIGMGTPKGVEGVDIPSRKGGATEVFISLSTPETLIGMAQMGVMEIHPWGSKNSSLEKPDQIVFDLDPDSAISWETLATSALEVRERLQAIGLESFVKCTGGKGLHVVAPIRPEHEWPAVKDFTHKFVLAMEKDNPKLFLTKMSKAARKGKIFLDYLRNERGSTAVAPYSPRARAGVPVALPLDWTELAAKELPQFRVVNFAKWQNRLQHDPWKDFLSDPGRLTQKLVSAA